eukprot:scaffold476689_cov19-Prasinocladus_malaysianus.AAC.1
MYHTLPGLLGIPIKLLLKSACLYGMYGFSMHACVAISTGRSIADRYGSTTRLYRQASYQCRHNIQVPH